LKTGPSPNGEGLFFLFYLLLFKKIVFQFLIKVDGQVPLKIGDKCPVRLGSFLQYLLNADKGWNDKLLKHTGTNVLAKTMILKS
jgi:hypothetical protein